MTAPEFLATGQGALQDVGRVLLELTAVLVLAYLLFFVLSLVVAALPHQGHTARSRSAATSRRRE